MQVDLDIEGILESRTFAKTTALRELLCYLWAHRDSEPSEYSIAIEALHRKEDFDPRLDATVRVNIARLRTKLRDYYQDESPGEEAVLEIPHGSYVVRAVPRHEQGFEAVARRPAVAWMGWIVAAILGASTLYLALAEWRPVQASQTADSKLSPIWENFLGDARETTIIFAAPAFFDFEGTPLKVGPPSGTQARRYA